MKGGTPAAPIPTERDAQRGVVQLYQGCGCVVFSLSQGYRPGGKRHGTTRQTKGLPDLLVCHEASGTAWSHEVKRPGGQQRPEQAAYERVTVRCGLPYALGGIGAACLALRTLAGVRVLREPADGDRLATALLAQPVGEPTDGAPA